MGIFDLELGAQVPSSRAEGSSREMAESHRVNKKKPEKTERKKNKNGRDELGQAEARLGPPFGCRITVPQPRRRFTRWIGLSSSLD